MQGTYRIVLVRNNGSTEERTVTIELPLPQGVNIFDRFTQAIWEYPDHTDFVGMKDEYVLERLTPA